MEQLIAFALPAALGIGLAAATGFRVFLPLLVTGFAVRLGYVPVDDSFSWIATTPALLMLAVAAITEVIAYYVPVLDNLLDGIAGPIAVGAGIAVSAAVMADLPPMLKWTLAIIAGGGAAATMQGATTLLRGKSTIFTAGLGNHALATAEVVGALVMSFLAIILPYAALLAFAGLCWLAWRLLSKLKRRQNEAAKKT